MCGLDATEALLRDGPRAGRPPITTQRAHRPAAAFGRALIGDRALSASSAPRVWTPARSRFCYKLGRYMHAADPCYCPTGGISHPAISDASPYRHGRRPARLTGGRSLAGRAIRSLSVCPPARPDLSQPRKAKLKRSVSPPRPCFRIRSRADVRLDADAGRRMAVRRCSWLAAVPDTGRRLDRRFGVGVAERSASG